MRVHTLLAAVVAGALIAPAGAQAAIRKPSLDTSFALTGVAYDDFGPGDEITALAVQPDGKIIAMSPGNADFNLLRLTPDGFPDPSFGVWGRVSTDVESSGYWNYPSALALLADGRIVVGGSVSPEGHQLPLLVTYAGDGTVLSTIRPDLGQGVTDARVTGLSALAGGKLLVAFDAATEDGSAPPVLTRLLPDGTPDATFGTGGVVRADVGERDFDQVNGMAVAPDGRIVVSGSTMWWSTLPEPTGDIMLARFTPNGALDPSFGNGGRVTRDITGPQGIDGGGGPTVTADGRVLVTAWTQKDDTRRTALLRFLPNGRPDRSFDRDGLVTTAFGRLNSPVVGAGGRITVTGEQNDDVLLAEFRADGRLLWSDTTDVDGGRERGSTLVAQPDGKLLVGGLGQTESVAVFRFNR
ncbi:delta-60 repeat domain-containing protein [Actinoplanes sp. NPDC048796]|uniref:delta-60 repeat domain-containing protein n=1 Tax=unclassified Actinoplanes TaxID=2626549 RepID=UPI0033E30483